MHCLLFRDRSAFSFSFLVALEALVVLVALALRLLAPV